MEWNIGKVKIKNQVVLAPMAGVSDPAYMKICEEMGVGYAITELISAEAIVRNNKKTFDMLNGINELSIPIAIQLFGSNSETLAKAAKIVNNLYPKAIIDINMGCPVPKVAIRANAGSALLKSPEKVYEIVKAVTSNVSTCVTVKIRSGWDNNHINAVCVAKEIERAGALAIAIHARTRSDGYSGKANWNIIKEVKQAVSIPIIGNGDIKTPMDAKKMLEETGCDAVMIGRAVLGNPWLIKNTVQFLETNKLLKEHTELEKINMCIKHLNYLEKTKTEHVAVLEIRNHIGWYFKGMEKAKEIKEKIYKTSTIRDIMQVLNYYKEINYGKK